MTVNQGEKIKVLRKSAGFTQTKLALKCGVSLATIQRIEPLAVVPKGTLLQICEATGWSMSEFVENKEYSYTTDSTLANEPTAVYHKENDINFILKELISIKNMLFEINKKLDK
jgi:transcriptional regulator with XRE-family HTH domain